MNKEVQQIIKRNQYRSRFYETYKKPKRYGYKVLKPQAKQKRFAFDYNKFVMKILAAVIVLLLGLIVKQDERMTWARQLLFSHLNLKKIETVIVNQVGSLFPVPEKKDLYVNLPVITVSNTTKYRDGVKVKTDAFSGVQSHVDGIVIQIKKQDELLGKMVVIQAEDGKLYQYGMLNQSDVQLYQRVSRGDLLGQPKVNAKYEGEYYLAISKNGKYLNVLEVIQHEN